jgi:cell division transport system permease protein
MLCQDQRTILEKFFRLLAVLRNGALARWLGICINRSALDFNTLRIAAFNRRRETGCDETCWRIIMVDPIPFLLRRCYLRCYWLGISNWLLAGLKSVVDSRVAPLLSFYQLLWMA